MRLGINYRGYLFGVGLALAVFTGCDNRSAKQNSGGTDVSTAGRNTSASDSHLRASRKHATAIRFADVTERSGIEFTYRNGEEAGNFSILESLGGGVALFDYDQDGDLDLFLPGGGEFGSQKQILGRSPALYTSLGDGKFVDVTSKAGVGLAPCYSHGAAAADVDNDGFTDVLVTGYGGLVLFHNQGDGNFIETARLAGLNDHLWSSSAAWGDFNGDGSLDLYVAHYVDWSFDNHPFCRGPKPNTREVCSPRSFHSLPHVFYLSQGDGTFCDDSRQAGLIADGPETGKGLGVLAADVDLDGKLDIYVANDTVPNFLYKNRGDGTFDDVSLMSGAGLNGKGSADGSMGVDLCDFDLDGLPDLWVANFERESFALYRNLGRCQFQHVSESAGVTSLGGLYVGWGTAFCDFDNDGDEDAFVSNGHVVRYPVDAPVRQRPLLLENVGAAHFVNVASQVGSYFVEEHMGRGAAAGDIDNDGRMDLAVSRTGQPAVLLENTTEKQNHWIGFRMIGTQSSRDPIGAFIRISGPNLRTQIRQVKGGASYASTSDVRLLFGLGTVSDFVTAEIHWPSGRIQTLRGLPSDAYLTVIER